MNQRFQIDKLEERIAPSFPGFVNPPGNGNTPGSENISYDSDGLHTPGKPDGGPAAGSGASGENGPLFGIFPSNE